MFYKVTYFDGENKIHKEYEIGYPCDVVSMLKEVETVIEDESTGKDIILISMELLTQ
ncbi:hypothetical protein [Veillonella ratti]|uniref:hypothetical protein n=1 Tax=Veillonella ratti TaxID=103892 RepID=UPI0013E082DD|nr:hypothetical protein [Veillonella ratti]